jgi:SAM-dependent methyltransferase
MDHHHQQAPGRGSRPARPVTIPARLEWTRQPGTGPGLAVLGPLAGRTVIELGCGSGHNLAHLTATHHATGTGIDRDPAKITRARHLYGHLPGLTFICGDAASILAAMPAASADVCLSIFGAFSFSPPGPLLAAAAHALRPGGRLAITLRADDHHDQVVILVRKNTATSLRPAIAHQARRPATAPSREATAHDAAPSPHGLPGRTPRYPG